MRKSVLRLLILACFLLMFFGLFALVQAYLVEQGVIPSVLGNAVDEGSRVVLRW